MNQKHVYVVDIQLLKAEIDRCLFVVLYVVGVPHPDALGVLGEKRNLGGDLDLLARDPTLFDALAYGYLIAVQESTVELAISILERTTYHFFGWSVTTRVNCSKGDLAVLSFLALHINVELVCTCSAGFYHILSTSTLLI